MLIEVRPPTDPALAGLLAAQQREIVERESGAGVAHPPVYPVHDGCRYVVAVSGGRAVGCGGVQALDADTAELKRMYVHPDFRGRGIARRLVAALEELARAAGHSVLRLETGDYLPAAIGLYTSLGYRPIPVFGEYVGNPHSVCFEKRPPIP